MSGSRPSRWNSIPALAAGIVLSAALVFPASGADKAKQPEADPLEALSGGAATTLARPDRDAFSHASANIADDKALDFQLGRALFRKFWVSSPSSTQASDGLGPLYNARSCQSCHQRDGRGPSPLSTGETASNFFRLARPAITEAEKQQIASLDVLNFPDPVYGQQLQDKAVLSLPAEGKMAVRYEDVVVTLNGGETVTLKKPVYGLSDLGYGPLDPHTTLSPRSTPPILGLGLIEAIPEADIRARADPDDADGDGISGKAAEIKGTDGKILLGRFGWKAQNATVEAQTAAAFAGDIGISTDLDPRNSGDCTVKQPDCLASPNGAQARLGKVEAPEPVLSLVSLYARNIAVPARRKASFPNVLSGKALFSDIGCATCHTPKFVTGPSATDPHLSHQQIWPFSDFLLHDMGDGLADGQQVGLADGREWRTPPLWGLGLARIVNPQSGFLHDGRADTLQAAILWHGGEAEKSRNAFVNMSKQDRKDLLDFLESL